MFWRAQIATFVVLICAVSPAVADVSQRFVVAGDRLIYDTTVPIDGEEFEIRGEDVNELRNRLRENSDIQVLEIKSTGGAHYPSMDLAALIIDFGLDTHIRDFCESACVTVFLAGEKRTLARGARLGFHQLSWDAGSLAKYYDNNKDHRDWETPFEFAEWMYQDTQTETYNRLSYMISRGVDAQFAIQTIRKPDTSMWFPYRAVLMAAGVLTE